MNLIKKYIAGAFALACANANAEVQSYGAVNVIYNYEFHAGTLIVLSNMANTSGYCPRNDYYILPLTHKYYSQDYAMLLSAKMAGKSVGLVFEPGDCADGMPRIRHVLVTQ